MNYDYSVGGYGFYDNPASVKDIGGLGTAAAASPSKPGFDYLAAGAGLQDLLGGIGDLVRGFRGEAPRMAGSKLQDYLQTQRQESYLADLLKAIIGKSTSSGEEFTPKKRADGPVFGSGYDPNTGLIY